jgi:hypothetical protein
MQAMLDDINSGDFHFDWLLAAAAFVYWIRFLFMLQLTSLFGPLIRTITAMLRDLFQFLVLFTIELIAFSCVGVLCFGMLKEYEDIGSTMIMFFQSAMGEWDFEIYTILGPEKKYFGIMFHITVITVNMILMLNLIIAIMSDTYTHLSYVKLGLYSQGIIEAIPVYKNDKHYGGLIVATPPINVITFLWTPCLACKKDKESLQKLNMRICRVIYFPVALVITIWFFLCNMILTPLALVKSLLHKCLLYKRTGMATYLKRAVVFLITGAPMFLVTLLVDTVHFFRHLYFIHDTV